MALDPHLFESRRFVQVHIDLVAEVGLQRAYLLSLIHFRSLGRKDVTETADGHGWWRASVPELAELTSLSERAVKVHLEALVDAGMLLREQHQVAGIFDRTNSYRVSFSAPSMGQDQPDGMGQNLPLVPPPIDTEEHTLIDLDAPQPQPEEASPFEQWWALWPKKTGKSEAERAFKRAQQRLRTHWVGTDASRIEKLLDLTTEYAQAVSDRDRQFIPNASTWLNQMRWSDVAEEVRMRAERDRAVQRTTSTGPRPQHFDRDQDTDAQGRAWDVI